MTLETVKLSATVSVKPFVRNSFFLFKTKLIHSFQSADVSFLLHLLTNRFRRIDLGFKGQISACTEVLKYLCFYKRAFLRTKLLLGLFELFLITFIHLFIFNPTPISRSNFPFRRKLCMGVVQCQL